MDSHTVITDQPRYQISLYHDRDCEDPSQYGYFEVIEFGRYWREPTRETHFACQWENEDWQCGESPYEHPMVLEPDEEPHQWVPRTDLVASLGGGSGHGPFTSWYVREMYIPGKPFSAEHADGVLTWRSDKEREEFFEHMPLECRLSSERCFERLREIADATLEEYEKWCNGDTWGYEVAEWDPELEEYAIEVDSCWGFIGDEYAIECAAESMDVDKPVRGVDYEIKEDYGY